MGALLNLGRYTGDFRYKVLKPMFVNFLMAANVFDMPASLFSRYLEFFDIETATPMQTWDQGTRRVYESMSADFKDSIYLDRPVRKIHRLPDEVIVEDENGNTETFDDVVFACNANQTLMMLDQPTMLESWLLSSIRYESELHNHTIVHSDASVLPDTDVQELDTRSNHIEQYGVRPDNYEITYIMHNQQPWAKRSDKPCLVTYNPITRIDEGKIIKKWWFQHIVHGVRHIALLIQIFRFIQGQEAHLALWRPYADQQPGDLFRDRPGNGKAARSRLSVSGFRGEEVVQLLRAYDVRLALEESVNLVGHQS